MFSLQFGYICTLVSVSIVFAWLSFQGPPRPTTHESNLPAQTFISVMELGNSTFAAWTDEANRLWDSEAVLPSNGGAVLATNLSSGFHFWAKPAMFHHLMCLREVRRQFVKMSASWDADFLSGRARSGSEYENLGYCFDYLRQVRVIIQYCCFTQVLTIIHRDCFAMLIPL